MGEDPSPGLAESGLLIIVPCTYQHIRCRLRRRSRNCTELADVNGDVPKEGFRIPGADMALPRIEQLLGREFATVLL